MTLPVALSGSDVIGQAKTGTGKTLGFGLPLLERVTVPADVEAGRATPEQLTDAPQALVVVPTRELCTQVTNDLLTAGKVRNVRVLAIYGGRAYEPQVEALKKGVDVIVGTPGRLLDLAGQKKLNLSHVKALVLDEADEMLDLGFLPDVEKIINMLPAKRQTMLFSATMPGAVIGLARRYMSQPTHIRATAPDDEGATVRNISQHVYRAHNMDKPEMVSRILQADGRGLAMIFCRTKRTAADIADQLKRRGFASGAVHGDLGQGAREQALRAFRNGKVDVLVCTDVAARGIDVDGVTHVINYQSPEDEKTYLHRIGRTGRAGKTGTAITLVDWDDIPRWQLINKALELNFNDPVETYSSSPHLFEELNIPAGTKGVLPRSERTRAGLDAEEIEDLGETGGRGASSRGGRGGRPGQGRDRDRDRDRDREQERERPARTPRRRRRTRAGEPLAAEGTAAAAAPVTPVADDERTVSAEPRTPRRRRRTRGGAQGAPAVGTQAAETVAAPVTPVAEPAPVVVETAPVVVETAPVVEAEAPAKPRRRTRKKAAEAVVETVEAVEVAQPAEAEEAPAAPRRRTRKKAEAAVDTAEAVEAKPATRTRKKAVAAAPAEETVTEAKPKRAPRKKAVAAVDAKAEAALDTAEAVEAKPKRTRKKAVAAAPGEETVTEAKPKRAPRKKAVAAAPAEVAEEAAEAKPRRTRKKAEAAVDTAEAVEAKPATRTRKKAVAAAPAEETVAEAKPKRAPRKKAVAAAPVEADAAEAPAKPRRTRKKAVAPEA
ncbi:DEAD/DEAH box helicase [Streptomyces sp. VRA16 Mangrove soil]|uniref:DEAD/DEAH box helicase n=1 Tax=Streptomyces sp. VRA16 Mangrove soil TaxID=2817434 RepID=UPI001A9DFDA2|nr:DEAD/DEAH box helicase [Streptomyces sp. VRA16 Mangrove soil]MBO1337060.1 DEAD/DEAH box helicase [Streptomyces sp. VRA16 Mangrove soil]